LQGNLAPAEVEPAPGGIEKILDSRISECYYSLAILQPIAHSAQAIAKEHADSLALQRQAYLEAT
jgi:hypothetical protein